ncbi:MAG TPA: 4-vinyl reductase [Anaerolineales bacterium]|nr:4-vinyl reductase [Anaerolineales bacterium]HNA88222.1 4-vinyl reductase [Anaerolineales bacterium]
MTTREEAVIINSLVRQALISMQEVMGDNGLNAVLKSCGLERFVGNFPPNDLNPSIKASQYAQLNQAIEDFYGRGGKGMLLRVGRASFQYGVREQAALLGIAGVALKLLPEKQRIKFILNGMADALKKSNPQVKAWVDETDDKLAYVDATCGVCNSRHSDHSICYLYIGSVSEAVKWATGKEYEVIETHCTAKGDEYCRFEVGNVKE